MDRVNKRILAEDKLFNPLMRFLLSHDYRIENGFINIIIKRKNRFCISIDKGNLMSISLKSDNDLEGMLNILYQFGKLYYETLFEGEIFKISLKVPKEKGFGKCKIVSMTEYRKVI
jgi:hypothetical protein